MQYHKTWRKRNNEPVMERDVESDWKKKVAELGWISEKFKSPEKRSVPDQIITIPVIELLKLVPAHVFISYPLVFYNELKAPGKHARLSQQSDHKKRRAAGSLVFVSDCYEQNDEVIAYVQWAVANDCYSPYSIPMHLMI